MDITEDPEYQAFVESMVPHCHCRSDNRPCDGVLAGGICDNVQEDLDEPERCVECGGRGAILGESCTWCDGTGED